MAKEDVSGTAVDETVEAQAEDGAEETVDIKETLKKAIKVDISDAGVLRKTLAIRVPRENLQTELDKEFKELITEATVPGFRKGRAPRRLIEKRFSRDVNDQVQTRIVSNAYLAAIEREDVKVLGDPLVWVNMKDRNGEDKDTLVDMQVALAVLKIPEEGDFEFRCEVEVKPEFELPELEGIEIQKPVVQITDEDVAAQVDRIRARRGTLAPVDESAVVQADDFLICDVVMKLDGNEVKKSENVPLSARAQMIEGAIVSDFGEKMAGARVGDTRAVEGALSEDHPVAEMRGKMASFDVKILEIKRLQLPALDHAFVSSMGFDSEEELRSFVRTNMESQLGDEIRRGMHGQVRGYLTENTKLDLPEGLSARQAERIASRRRVELQRQGVPDEEIAKHADELMTSAREQAVAELKLFFILDKIAEKWEIDVTEEELNAQIASIARSYNKRFDRVRDELTRNNGMTMLYLEIRDEKCIEEILKKAKVTESTPEQMKAAQGQKETAGKSGRASAKTATSTEGGTTETAAPKKSKKPAAGETGETAPKARKKSAESAESGEEASKPKKKTTRKKSE